MGNHPHVLVSELSGKATIKQRVKQLGYPVDDDKDIADRVLARLKEKEHEGYHYEAADASFELLVRAEMGLEAELFRLEAFRIIVEQREDGSTLSEATVKVHVGGERFIETAEGNGPVNALDKALRMGIERRFPNVHDIHLVNYRVRILDEDRGTAATTRVIIDSSDGRDCWGSVGVGENVVEASWEALVDSISYGLLLAAGAFEGDSAAGSALVGPEESRGEERSMKLARILYQGEACEASVECNGYLITHPAGIGGTLVSEQEVVLLPPGRAGQDPGSRLELPRPHEGDGGAAGRRPSRSRAAGRRGAATHPVLQAVRRASSGMGTPSSIPSDATRVEYEGELAVAIARDTRRVTPDEAETRGVGLDLRERRHRARPAGPGQAVVAGQGLRHFRRGRTVPGDGDSHLRTRGSAPGSTDTLRQEGQVRDMIRDPFEIISLVSQAMTLERGDLIMLGTPPGVGELHARGRGGGRDRRGGLPAEPRAARGRVSAIVAPVRPRPRRTRTAARGGGRP